MAYSRQLHERVRAEIKDRKNIAEMNAAANRDKLTSQYPEFLFIEEELAKIGFKLHPKKTRIFPVTEKIRFLGFDFQLTETGKVVVTKNPQNVKAERKKLRRLVAKSKRGEIPKESVDESYRCWREHVSYGNSYKLIQRMDKYYSDLWKEK